MSRFFVGPSLSVYQVEEVEVIGGINVRRVCVGSNRQVMSAPGTTRDPDPFKGHCPHSGMVTFAALALGLVTALGPRAVTDRALSELMEALA